MDGGNYAVHKSLDTWRIAQIFGGVSLLGGGTRLSAFYSSKPWSVQGTSLVWLEQNDEVGHLIGYAPYGGSENKFYFQPYYHACEINLIASASEISPEYAKALHKMYGRNPTDWFTMNFNP
jgi:hypothetical protein